MIVRAILCLAGAFVGLAACSAPAPQTATAQLPPTRAAPTPTASPIPPTATPTATPQPTATPIPKRVVIESRGSLACGIDPSRLDYDATQVTFDIDLCRAVAAALFDNPDEYTVVLADPSAAAAALTAGEIDLYVGPTDLMPPGVAAGPTLFIDATGAVARTDVGIRQILDLKAATVCLIQDSIDEQLFSAAAAAARVSYQPLLFNADDVDGMYARYDQGHCDAVVDNRIRLAQRLPALTVPRDHGLIDLVLPIGARGLLTASDDANWSEIAAAVGDSLIRAEQLGVDSQTVGDALSIDDAAIRQLLGVEEGFGRALGLSDDFAARAIAHVGNYGEIYSRYYPNLPREPIAPAPR